MRILENEQTLLPETAEVAARVGLSPFDFVRRFGEPASLQQEPHRGRRQ